MRAILRAHFASGIFLAVGIAVIAVLPSFMGQFETRNMSQVGLYFIALLGLNIVTGYSGQISLGQGAFMGVGGYTTAYLAFDHGWSVWWTIPVAAAIAGVSGFLFGLPALRLHGPYLALGTFALAVAFVDLVRSDRFGEVTGGSQGIQFALPAAPYYPTWGIALGGAPPRLVPPQREVRTVAASGARCRARGRLVRAQPGGVQDRCLRAFRRVRGRRRRLARDPSRLGERDRLPADALDHAARGHGARRLRRAVRDDLRRVVHPVRAAEGRGLGAATSISRTPLPPSVTYGVFLLLVLFLMPGGLAQLVLRIRGLFTTTKRRYTRHTVGEGTTQRSDT